MDDSETDYDLFMKRIAGGDVNTVQRKVAPPISFYNFRSESPSIAIDSTDNIYIVLAALNQSQSTGSIILKKSTDGGKSFTQSTILKTNTALNPSPHIIIDSEKNIYIFWKEDNNDEIHFRKSTDGGKTFTLEKQIEVSNSPDSNNYEVAVDSKNNLYVVWYAKVFGKGVPPMNKILLIKSTDGGNTFGSQIEVGKSVTDIGTLPRIALDFKDAMYITWVVYPSNDAGPSQTLLKKSSDGGNTFTPEKQINTSYTWSGYLVEHEIAAR